MMRLLQHHSKLLLATIVLALLVTPLTAQSAGGNSSTLCNDGNTRLENSTNSYIDGNYFYGGRVEVCYNGTYRPVCDEDWTDSEAAVVCNNLGYSSSYYRSEATGQMVFGLSDETPVLQNLMCNGSEYSLSDCSGYDLNAVTGDYCLSGDYQAGIRCIQVPTPTTPCYDGDIRLENSTYSYIYGDYFYGGRVEVCYNGTYRPVCDENWTDSEAAVVCNNLGYSSSYYRSEATGQMVFGLSDETPVLQNLMCNGSEYSLSYCPGYDLNAVTGDYCLSGDYQAGIRCIQVPTPTTPCYDGEIRLENSTYSYIYGDYFYGGRVEVCYNGTYRPVCDEDWTDSEAAVVCNNLGYSSSYYRSEATGQMVFGLSDETPVLQNLMCNGSEYSLSYCPGYDLNAVTGDYCLSGDYQAGVRCIQVPTPTTPCYDGDIRLENSTYSYIYGDYFYGGRVEVCYNGTYRPVCDENWTDSEAAVVCNNLGYSSSYYRSEATGQMVFGLSDETPVLQNLMCNGSEYSLSYCPGYDLNAVTGDYCLSGDYQAGIRCIQVPTPTTPCYDGEIRLENSTYSYIYGDYFYGGRVEVCYNGTYQPVCDEDWTDSEAAVVCNNLGYSSSYYRSEATGQMVFGLSDETPVLQNLMCNGSEYSLSYCPGYDLNAVTGDYCLSGDYQAGIRCIQVPTPTTPCYDGDIRLENSTYSYIYGDYFYGGRVEVCYNGTYRPVCDEDWTDSEAAVVCNNLGYSSSYYRSEATGQMVFGLSDETPVLQNLMCNGSEYSLSDCSGYDLNAVTGDYCLSGDYQAGIRCIQVPTPTTPCYDGDIRLENSTYSYIYGDYFYGGRVEVCYNGTYRPVCDEDWTDSEAAVVCNNLGYSSSYYRSEATGQKVFGLSDETPVLQNLMCNGSEYSLSDCSGYDLNAVTGDYCLSGDYQAGIRCIQVPTPTTPCYDGDIRLENSTYSYIYGDYFYGGRVEVCYNGTYRPVCDEDWTDSEAAVVCNNLGYSSSYYRSEATGQMVFGLSDETPVLQNLMCNGSEYSLSYCPGYDLNAVTGDYCLSGDYQAGIRCIQVPTPTMPCYDGDIRLENSTYSYIYGDYFYGGRVEVCYNGTYRPVCDEDWTDSEAAVVCNNLGYSSSNYRSEATGQMVFGLSDGTPVLQNLMCNGSEYSLSDCPGYDLNVVTGDYCLSGDYQAGVRCIEVPTPTTPCYDGEIRLENSTYPYIYGGYFYGGRVEVCYNGTYQPVCDEAWTDSEATVVCNNLGYSSSNYRSEATGQMVFGLSDETPVLQNLMCSGSEYTLSDCPGYDLNAVTGDYCLSGDYQAGVRCIERCDDENIRLGDMLYGITPEGYGFIGGRVEICLNGMYGAVCDIGWNTEAAQSACDRIGYSDRVGIPTFGSYFGAYDGPIILQNITCSSAYNCTGTDATHPACNSDRIAGVMCVNEPRPCTEGDVILGNYTNAYFQGTSFIGGRVEVCVNGTYRPICDQDWNDRDACVVCSSMGYNKPNYNGQATGNATFSLSNQQPIVLDVACNGTEYALNACDGYSIDEATSDYCLSGQYQAGVRCLEVVTSCFADGYIELSNIMEDRDTDYDFSFVARVDYCYNETLRGVCDVGWNDEDAAVACRRRGEGLLSEAISGLAYGPRVPVIDNVMCNGSETELDQCLTSEPDQISQACTETPTRAAGVRCYQVCYPGSLRLFGGEHSAIGRVEICNNNTWGTVCDLDWDDRDAAAACMSAGFYWGGEAISNIGFGNGTGPILASNISCNGGEYTLGNCYNTTDIPDVCTHERDAAASCQPAFIDMNIAVNRSTEVIEGNNVTLWCNAQSTSVANLTSYSWQNSQGEIMSDDRINITLHNKSYSNYYGEFIFNSSLTFSPLLPSDGDRYVCELTIALPEVGINISNTTASDFRVRVLPPTLDISYTTPFVNSTFNVTCTAEISSSVPYEAIELVWVESEDSPQFDYSNTVRNETHIIIESVLASVELNDNLQYICQAGIDGDYVYTQQVSSRNISLTPIVIPTLIEGPAAKNIVINSSTARSSDDSQLTATFTCIIDSQPLARVTWDYKNIAGNTTINDSRISVRNDNPSQERQVSTLAFNAVVLGDQGRFTCNAVSPYGSVSSTANLNIFVTPDEISVEATSGTQLTEGDTIVLNCSVDGSWPAPTQIQWLKDGNPFLVTSARVTITTQSASLDSYGLYVQMSSLMISDTHADEDSGVYTCKAYFSIPGVPTLRGDLSITVQVRNECIIQMDPLTIPCVNGACVDGFNTYTCLCYDGYTGRNCDEEVTTRTAPSIVEQPLNTTGRAGQAINLTCTVMGVPTPSITWFQDGNVVEGAIFQFLYFPSVRPEDRGLYYCEAKNSEGTVESNTALLNLDGIQQFNAALTFPSRVKRQGASIDNLANELVGQMIGDLGVTIYSVSTSGDSNLLITVAAADQFPPGGVGDALSDQIVTTAEAEGIEIISIEATRFDGCPMEQGLPYLPYFPEFRITWPESEIGQTATESCACGNLDTVTINYQATRVCGGNYRNGAAWRTQDVSQCIFSNTTLQLCRTIGLPVDEQASSVADIVSNSTEIDADTFAVAVEIIADLFTDATDNPEIIENVLMSVDSLLNVDDETAQEERRSSSVLLNAIEGFTGSVEIPAGQSTRSFSQERFAISAEQTDSNNFRGLTFSTNSSDNFNRGRIATSSGNTVPDDSFASVMLPSSLLDDLDSANEPRRFSFGVFADDTLFPRQEDSSEYDDLEVGSVIISVTLHGSTVRDLTDSVSLSFKKAVSRAPSVCVFWDSTRDGGRGGYSTEGCTTDDQADIVTCSCNHLTSFTILSNNTAATSEPVTQTPTPTVTQTPTPTIEPVTQPPTPTIEDSVDDDSKHSSVVFLLLSISLVLLLVTIALHLGLRALRETNESKILVNTAVSLCALYFVTMLAYGKDMPEGACRLWAFLLVYFFIVTLFWGFLEALFLMLKLKMSTFGNGFFTRNYTWIAMSIAWGLPVIPALVSLAGLDNYAENRLCQVYNWPFYAFMIAPLILFYTFDWLLYIATLTMITHWGIIPESGKDAHRSIFYHIFTAMLLSLVFGIGWAFGFLASSDVSRDAYLTGQYLFSFLILTHTVLQMILCLLRTHASREELRCVGYTVSCRRQEYKVNVKGGHEQRSNIYVASPPNQGIETISLEESGKKKPPTTTEAEVTTPMIGQNVTQGPAGSANQLADDEDAVTSYTNKEAIEGSGDSDKVISSF